MTTQNKSIGKSMGILKERVNEVNRLLNYERPDIAHAHDMAKIVYNKQDIQYIKELIKDQQSRIEELEAALRGLLPFRTAPQMGSYEECQRRIKIAKQALNIKDDNK